MAEWSPRLKQMLGERLQTIDAGLGEAQRALDREDLASARGHLVSALFSKHLAVELIPGIDVDSKGKRALFWEVYYTFRDLDDLACSAQSLVAELDAGVKPEKDRLTVEELIARLGQVFEGIQRTLIDEPWPDDASVYEPLSRLVARAEHAIEQLRRYQAGQLPIDVHAFEGFETIKKDILEAAGGSVSLWHAYFWLKQIDWHLADAIRILHRPAIDLHERTVAALLIRRAEWACRQFHDALGS